MMEVELERGELYVGGRVGGGGGTICGVGGALCWR